MPKKILIVGASGLIGSSLFKYFSTKNDINVFGTIRSKLIIKVPSNSQKNKLFTKIDLQNKNDIEEVFEQVLPDVVINCAGITSGSKEISNYYNVITLNSLLPHYLSDLSNKFKARLIQISTDCVFSGKKGNYIEDDYPDSNNLYGRSKSLGEITSSNAITLRTSTIGHEVNSPKGLMEWFLSQKDSVAGYKNYIFSGLTTIEIGRIIYEYILFNSNLVGLYHLSGNPISKFDLLLLIKKIYNKNIKLMSDYKVVINRSLNSSKFRDATGFSPKSWPLMIEEIKRFEKK
tara:strand:+ start:220 stop:1086 length:867 start_codon:yes stop_codon:yes gene_type:complete